jgi:hypothetical protein
MFYEEGIDWTIAPPPKFDVTENSTKDSLIDAFIKIMIGLGSIAVLMGMIIALGIIVYTAKKIRK